MFYLAFALNSLILMLLAAGVTILLVAGLGLFGSALNGVYQAALYNYATTGDASRYFEQRLITSAFRPKNS